MVDAPAWTFFLCVEASLTPLSVKSSTICYELAAVATLHCVTLVLVAKIAPQFVTPEKVLNVYTEIYAFN